MKLVPQINKLLVMYLQIQQAAADIVQLRGEIRQLAGKYLRLGAVKLLLGGFQYRQIARNNKLKHLVNEPFKARALPFLAAGYLIDQAGGVPLVVDYDYALLIQRERKPMLAAGDILPVGYAEAARKRIEVHHGLGLYAVFQLGINVDHHAEAVALFGPFRA